MNLICLPQQRGDEWSLLQNSAEDKVARALFGLLKPGYFNPSKYSLICGMRSCYNVLVTPESGKPSSRQVDIIILDSERHLLHFIEIKGHSQVLDNDNNFNSRNTNYNPFEQVEIASKSICFDFRRKFKDLIRNYWIRTTCTVWYPNAEILENNEVPSRKGLITGMPEPDEIVRHFSTLDPEIPEKPRKNTLPKYIDENFKKAFLEFCQSTKWKSEVYHEGDAFLFDRLSNNLMLQKCATNNINAPDSHSDQNIINTEISKENPQPSDSSVSIFRFLKRIPIHGETAKDFALASVGIILIAFLSNHLIYAREGGNNTDLIERTAEEDIRAPDFIPRAKPIDGSGARDTKSFSSSSETDKTDLLWAPPDR